MKYLFLILSFYFTILVIGKSCENLEPQNATVITVSEKNNDDCIQTKRISDEDSIRLITLMRESGFSYIINTNKKLHIYRTIDGCINNQYNIIFTQLILDFSDSIDVKKIENKFLVDSVTNMRLKGWNRIFLDNQGSVLVFTVLENRDYVNTWKKLLN